ncbi:ABC transporter ATP-binding protein [Ramlibacter monticola]|uniref:Spermidine/putrescine import ATP-binding protein PotA n=1 Tax=Ramlibacter monticola TaxID=1926872 RepID=A0A937CYC5_9BURK|nr:ABC transporter ATP-binding protein [Ramlibacter monticola]MBL0394832.1 ABC transporter ATP-binding protein [Ramlibacter monticola]
MSARPEPAARADGSGRAPALKLVQPPLVSFTGVQKSYDGSSLVVRDLDLEIRRGEFLTLLGPSGSGKTTTLMMLAGFESPTQGEISLAGTPITRTPPHKRNFGMVFQNYALFPHMTVEQNVAYPLTVRKVPREEQKKKVAQALESVRLGPLGSRYPAQLSGGQQQRVALARALVFEPQLVLMDEPLGALDKQLREHMQVELKELHRQLGLTFVYVTHDQSEALTMSDRVAVFNDGAIQQIDRVDRLYETPSNRFVASFVGDSTLLEGVVTGSSGSGCIVGLPNGVRVSGVNVNGAQPGDRVVCCIRPERVELTGVLNQANTFEATVVDVLYFGDHLRLRCTVPGQPEAMVKLPLGRHEVPSLGETVFLYAAEEHLRIYL